MSDKNDKNVTQPAYVEKRLHTRHCTNTEVFVYYCNDTRVSCKAENLSAGGAGIRTNNLGLHIGQIIKLVFIVDFGTLAKIHRRTAKVCHINNGMTGFHFQTIPSNR